MSKVEYYGDDSNQVISFLEFGSIDVKNQNKNVWGFLLHQAAYDSYMFSRYSKDMFYFRDFIESENPTVDHFWETSQKTAHRDLQANMLKYAGYRAVHDNTDSGEKIAICEIGSSLFGLIDEISALDKLTNNGRCIKSIETGKYVGCEISELMNRGAKELHPKASFNFYTDSTASEFLKHELKYDFLYGLSISLQYSLRSAQDIVGLIKKSKLSVIRRFFLSMDETRSIDIGTGKKGYYISLKEFLHLLKEAGISSKFYNFRTSMDRKTRTIAIDIVAGEPRYIERFTHHYQNFHKMFTESTPFQAGAGHEWSDFSSLSKIIEDKDLSYIARKKTIIFGTGAAAIAILSKLNQHHIQVDYCVDNDEKKWGERFAGYPIRNPDFLLQEDKANIIVIIASMYYGEISAQLIKAGFREFEHFINYNILFYS
jgi:hypothetical protein